MLAGERGWWAWNPCKICGCWWRCWRPSTLWCGCLCERHFYVNQYCGFGKYIMTCPFHSFQNRVWVLFEHNCSWMSPVQSSSIARPDHRKMALSYGTLLGGGQVLRICWHDFWSATAVVALEARWVYIIFLLHAVAGSSFWQCNWDMGFIFTPFMNQSISLWCAYIDDAWRKMETVNTSSIISQHKHQPHN